MSDPRPPLRSLRDLPSVDRLLGEPTLRAAVEADGHDVVTDAVRQTLEAARAWAMSKGSVPQTRELVEEVVARVEREMRPRPRGVINATGVILHTNLGRAPVSAAAAAAMARVAAEYSDLEYELESGRRGSRHDQLQGLLARVTGAEAALVVNNNAGATMLVLAALAGGSRVVVSRGELVEIGGGFRLPDVFETSGARLHEVGTTNRTYLADYRRALVSEDDPAALILRVHTSNYRVVGFTRRPSLEELVQLGREQGVPVVDDLGSGSLLDTTRFGLGPEPMVGDSVSTGAALTTFSGDKLLGGPQAGVIVGEASWISRVRRHPLTRALRPDKSTIAGLHATLLHYWKGEAEQQIPIWRMISTSEAEVEARAEEWLRRIVADSGLEQHDSTTRDAPRSDSTTPDSTTSDSATSDSTGRVSRIHLSTIRGASTVGGGSLPGSELRTRLLALEVATPDDFTAVLRACDPPIVARIWDGKVVLDPRTVLPEQDDALVAGLATCVKQAP